MDKLATFVLFRQARYLKKISSNLADLDVDPNVTRNQLIKSVHVYDGTIFPFHDQSFDIVVSDYVNEHISNPNEHICEIFRVLTDEGYYIFRTPNRFHYVSVVGSLTPHWFHRIVSKWLRKIPQDAIDPHPAKYLFNTGRSCRKILVGTGFEIIEMELIEKEPSYGMNSRALFLVFMVYERVVNSTEFFRSLRGNIFCVGRKHKTTKESKILSFFLYVFRILKNLFIVLLKFDRHLNPERSHIRYFDKRGLERCLNNSGFVPISWSGIGRFWKIYRTWFVVAQKCVVRPQATKRNVCDETL